MAGYTACLENKIVLFQYRRSDTELSPIAMNERPLPHAGARALSDYWGLNSAQISSKTRKYHPSQNGRFSLQLQLFDPTVTRARSGRKWIIDCEESKIVDAVS